MDRTFPQRPRGLAPKPTSVEQVVRRAPLSPIHEVLSISIHDVVNSPRQRRIVADFYRVTRWMQNEWWLRRQMEEL